MYFSIVKMNAAKGTIDVFNPKDLKTEAPRAFTFDAVYDPSLDFPIPVFYSFIYNIAFKYNVALNFYLFEFNVAFTFDADIIYR